MTPPLQQAGTIAVRDGRVCLVTSRTSRRWVIPKGQIDPGHTPLETALAEAWEEAGLVGLLDPEPLGGFTYEKWDREHHVVVYRMQIEEVHDNWPERSFRQRSWFQAEEVIERVEEPGLREIIVRLFRLDAVGRTTFT